MRRRTSTWDAYRQRLRFDEAAAAFEAALRAAPEFVEAAKSLGNLRSRQDKNEQAVAAFRQVLKFGRTTSRSHNELGIVLARLRRLRRGGGLLPRGDPNPARLSRCPQQPGQRPAEPGQARPGTCLVSRGAAAAARVPRGVQQCRDRPETPGQVQRGGGQLRAGAAAAVQLSGGPQQPGPRPGQPRQARRRRRQLSAGDPAQARLRGGAMPTWRTPSPAWAGSPTP